MAKKVEAMSEKNLALQESIGKEEEVKETTRIGDTNIAQFSAALLLSMWNTSTEQSFADQYPEATFNRRQCKYWLEKMFKYEHIDGFMAPGGFKREAIIELINSFNGDVQKASDKHQMVYNDGETERTTIRTRADVMARWKEMLDARGVKPADHHIYYTLALQMLMDELEAGLKIVREM